MLTHTTLVWWSDPVSDWTYIGLISLIIGTVYDIVRYFTWKLMIVVISGFDISHIINDHHNEGSVLMFADMKNDLDHTEVLELLSYSVFPDPDRLESTVTEYRTNPNLKLYGLLSGEELLGVIGYEAEENGTVRIRHIAVQPDHRGDGYGRGMILELIALEQPAELITETDEEAIDFYRNIGFTIESIGEVFPGVERYQCSFRPTYS